MKYLLPMLIYLAYNYLIDVEARRGRIIGGSDAAAGQFPYAAAIYIQTANGRYFCGGSLLTNQWLITSALCIYNAESFTIQLGSTLLAGEDPEKVILATSEFVVHPDFNPNTLENDIGLIKLRMPILYTTYIAPLHLAVGTSIINTSHVTTLGWGQTSDENASLSEKLQFVGTAIMPLDDCKLIYGTQINENMVCIEGNFNEGTCVGDNGSPLITRYLSINYIIAVASFISQNGCESTDPSGFTSTLPYVQWIRNVTGMM